MSLSNLIKQCICQIDGHCSDKFSFWRYTRLISPSEDHMLYRQRRKKKKVIFINISGRQKFDCERKLQWGKFIFSSISLKSPHNWKMYFLFFFLHFFFFFLIYLFHLPESTQYFFCIALLAAESKGGQMEHSAVSLSTVHRKLCYTKTGPKEGS